eukprot:TCALIF_04114-PA protein Name:"Similar to CAPRIN2 Caprin-2 (Homo sapiens)" AED:0.05 eAED:0.05 QI:0/0.75/0.8/0.8/0.25/0.4/5/1624/245
MLEDTAERNGLSNKAITDITTQQLLLMNKLLFQLQPENQPKCQDNSMSQTLLDDLKNFWIIKDQVKNALITLAELIVQVQNAEESLRYLDLDNKYLKRTLDHLKLDVRSLKKSREKEGQKSSVYFDASRSTDFALLGNLTYTYCQVNVGNGLDLATGTFQAPVSGTYLFSFHANTMKGKDGLVLMKKNGDIMGGMYDTDNFNHNTLAQSLMVALNEGDMVWIEILSGGVRSNENIYVHFSGLLIR